MDTSFRGRAPVFSVLRYETVDVAVPELDGRPGGVTGTPQGRGRSKRT